MEIREMYLEDVVPGMTVAKDVYSDKSGLIIGKNTVITAKGITRLKLYGVKRLWIVTSGEKKEKDPKIIKETEDFIKFKSQFQETTDIIKENLNAIIDKNEEIHLEELLLESSSLLKKSDNGIHMLEMIQGMRDMDDLTYVHSLNVSLICTVFGNWLKLSEEEVNILTISGLLHDIGKLMIPAEILNKPGKLTPNEFAIVKQHTQFGYDILKNKNLDERILEAVLTHHERSDGSGYPRGISDKEISPIAKILAIADVYDAMTARRVYRDEISPFEVIRKFEEEGFNKYDPTYIIPLLEMIVQSYIGSNVKLSNNKIGEVILINKYDLSRPVVRMDNEFMDMSKTKDIQIEHVV